MTLAMPPAGRLGSVTEPEPTETDRAAADSDLPTTPEASASGPADGPDDVPSNTEDAVRGRTRRGIRKGLLLLITVVVFIYLVLPLFADARRDVETVSSVNWWMLLLAVVAVMIALLAYTQLTMVALPREGRRRPIGFGTLFRIQLSVKAVSNVVPGGTATSSAVGYRLMTSAGVKGTDTGFALATVGLGSAVILNVILWEVGS